MSHGKPTESNLKTVPLVAITLEKKEEPVTEAIQVLPLHTPEQVAAAPPQAVKTEKLPQTGSSIPLIGLLGVAALTFGLGLKLLVKQALCSKLPVDLSPIRSNQRFVAPSSQVGVLRSSSTNELTLITCFPFDYIGRAPKRFIVRGREIASSRK